MKTTVKISIEKLKEVVTPEVLNQLIEDCQKSSKLVDKYGEKLPIHLLEDEKFVKSLLHHSIIVMYNNEAYTLPLRVDGRELKLYYRKEK